ncbi:MAG TPA: VOC family protein, partial [Actinomycetes bacterium]|nr:VOC family protein [Actinomycetes bacterium]
TEQLLDGNGHQIGVWMERSHSPHDLAVVTGANGGLHHFAFWLDDWDHVRKAADILAYNGVQIDVGPTRTSPPSPGPRTTSAGRSSTTRAT